MQIIILCKTFVCACIISVIPNKFSSLHETQEKVKRCLILKLWLLLRKGVLLLQNCVLHLEVQTDKNFQG
jgi:hypothetical protein